MTPTEMARIHRAAFSADRAWTKEEFAQLLGAFGVECFAIVGGFALTRRVVDEVELLTVAIEPDRQGKGLGHRLMTLWIERAVECGACTAFLEVAADNSAALALYQSHGFVPAGRRKGYYGRHDQPAVDALLMTLALPLRPGAESPRGPAKTG